MLSRASMLLLAAVAILAVQAAAQDVDVLAAAKHGHKGCSYRHVVLNLPFTPISADLLVPPTPAVEEVPIATTVVRNFYIRPEGQPNGPNIGVSRVFGNVMDAPGTTTRVASVVLGIKFSGGEYDGWLTATGVLNYNFAGAAPVVTTDYSITGGTDDFLGAVGSLTTTLTGAQGALVLTLDIPRRECFASSHHGSGKKEGKKHEDKDY